MFGDQAVQAEAAKGLVKAKGVLRQEVGRTSPSGSRRPWSSSPTRSRSPPPTSKNCSRTAKKRDAEVADLAADASEGKADPYESDAPPDVELDEDDFDEEDLDLADDGEIDEDRNR